MATAQQPPGITSLRKNVIACALQILNNPIVTDVELFGSFARGEEHTDSDTDMIIVVSDTHVVEWLVEIIRSVEQRGTTGHMRSVRRQCGENILGIELPDNIDVFLLPPNWRVRRDEFQQLRLPPDFMGNIVRDALPFNHEKRAFPWP